MWPLLLNNHVFSLSSVQREPASLTWNICGHNQNREKAHARLWEEVQGKRKIYCSDNSRQFSFHTTLVHMSHETVSADSLLLESSGPQSRVQRHTWGWQKLFGCFKFKFYSTSIIKWATLYCHTKKRFCFATNLLNSIDCLQNCFLSQMGNKLSRQACCGIHLVVIFLSSCLLQLETGLKRAVTLNQNSKNVGWRWKIVWKIQKNAHCGWAELQCLLIIPCESLQITLFILHRVIFSISKLKK